jgi:Tfp pilus assembly protein FimT
LQWIQDPSEIRVNGDNLNNIRRKARKQASKYNSNYQVKKDKTGRECSTNGEKRNACKLLVGKPKRKRTRKTKT